MRILLLGLTVLVSACTAAQSPSPTPACSGAPSDPVGCVAKIAFGGITYLDRGYVALTDDAKAGLAASGTMTATVEWLPSADRAAPPMLSVGSGEAEYAGAAVWTVPGIDPGLLVLLGPFPQEWEPNLYELFLAQGGSQDPPLAICTSIKRISKANPPLVCQPAPQAP